MGEEEGSVGGGEASEGGGMSGWRWIPLVVTHSRSGKLPVKTSYHFMNEVLAGGLVSGPNICVRKLPDI